MALITLLILRWIGLLRMLLAGWPSPWLRQALYDAALYRLLLKIITYRDMSVRETMLNWPNIRPIE
jgi:hypothetical protein